MADPTYQNPIFGKIKTKTAEEVSEADFLSTVEADGSIAKIDPINLPFTLKLRWGHVVATNGGTRTIATDEDYLDVSGSPITNYTINLPTTTVARTVYIAFDSSISNLNIGASGVVDYFPTSVKAYDTWAWTYEPVNNRWVVAGYFSGDLGAQITALPGKITLGETDTFAISDGSASSAPKKVTALNLYNNYLKPKNDLLYEKLTNKATNFTTVNNTLYPTVEAVKIYADGLTVGLLDDRGSYDASSNLFPTTGGSGTSGAILKGDIWFVSVAGTLGGKIVDVGDSFRALVDTPEQTASNWSVLSSNIGYVPANDTDVVHKFGSIAESITGTKTFDGGVVVNNPGIGHAMDVINTGPGIGLFGNNTSSGVWGSVNSFTASTGDLFRFTKNNVLTSSISATGEFMSPSIGIGVSPSSTTKLNVLQSNNLTATVIRNGFTSSHNILYMGNDSSVNASFLGSYKGDDSGFSTLILQKFGGKVLIPDLSGTGIRTVVVDASGNLSATDIAPTSGTYTPTLTTTTNLTSATFNSATYVRVGDIVTVTLSALINVTTTNTLTTLTATLPVNRVSAVALEVGSGVGFQSGYGAQFFPVHSQMNTNTTQVNFFCRPTNSGNHTLTASFSYKVN